MSPLQRRAFYSLILGIILSVALVAVFVTKDIYSFDDDLGFRLIVYALWIGVPLVYLLLVYPISKKQGQIDERDKLILERAPKIQWLAVIFTLAAWVITLTEVFWGQGQVPVIFLTLIFISILIVSTLAQSLGILIGYWRGVNYG